MTEKQRADAYRALRKQIGTQAEVAEALDIQRETIVRREGRDTPITREAELALQALAVARGIKPG